ncbi:MAG: pyridoxal phosphate-dependent aminotransferase [Kiritimatiellia bacterium]
MPSFSERTSWARTLTPLADACAGRASRSGNVLDLTCANPTQQGFVYAADVVADFWASGQSYAPHALGIPDARQAVADYFCKQGGAVVASQVWMGSGTSELYAHTMAVLCDPGACWLVPQPGYPLFDYVADLAGVQLAHYPLCYDGGWFWDEAALDAAVRASGARAIVVISPHNPTGHVWTMAEREMVLACCKRHAMALIVDEVFLDFPIDRAASIASCAGCAEVLTICLSGASKVAAYPQGKIAWAAVSGPGSDEFLARAELVSDTFLNTSTVIQAGLPKVLSAAGMMQERIRSRCRANLAVAREILADSSISVCAVQAGWSVLLRFPQVRDDAQWAMLALAQEGVLTHPGYLFGMEAVSQSPFLGISLLLEASLFKEGCARLARIAAFSNVY